MNYSQSKEVDMKIQSNQSHVAQGEKRSAEDMPALALHRLTMYLFVLVSRDLRRLPFPLLSLNLGVDAKSKPYERREV